MVRQPCQRHYGAATHKINWERGCFAEIPFDQRLKHKKRSTKEIHVQFEEEAKKLHEAKVKARDWDAGDSEVKQQKEDAKEKRMKLSPLQAPRSSGPAQFCPPGSIRSAAWKWTLTDSINPLTTVTNTSSCSPLHSVINSFVYGLNACLIRSSTTVNRMRAY